MNNLQIKVNKPSNETIQATLHEQNNATSDVVPFLTGSKPRLLTSYWTTCVNNGRQSSTVQKKIHNDTE